MGLQETQLCDSNNIDVDDFCDHNEFRHVGVQATRRSGGLLSIWDDKIYNITEVIRSRHFLITIGRWLGCKGRLTYQIIMGHKLRQKKEHCVMI